MSRRWPLLALLTLGAVALEVTVLEARPRRPRRPSSSSYVLVAPLDVGPFPDAAPPDSGDAGIWPDAAPPDSGDAGIWPDAAPADSGDGGLINVALVTGPSYFHQGGGTPVTPVWTDAGASAYQVIDGSVVAAVDRTGAAASIGAIQAAAAATSEPWVLLDYQEPSLPPWSYDLAALEANITAAAAWAADGGSQLCPRGHWDMVGGYYTGSAGLPFSDGGPSLAPDAGSHMEIVGAIAPRLQAHLTMLADAGASPGVAADCLGVPYYDLKGPQLGTSPDSGLVQQPYSGDFLAGTTTAPLLDTSGVEVQTDGLHFSQTGHQQAADLLGRTMARARSDGAPARFAPTAISVVDATTIDITFSVPCRTHGDCVDDPPLLIDVAGRVPQETLGAIESYGLHFWSAGLLQSPGAIASATPQTCTSPATSCDVRFVFASLPNFDAVSFGDTFCKIFGDVDCSFGPAAKYAGGSNVVSRVNSACAVPVDGGTACVEQPVGGRWTASPYDSGVAPDAAPVDAGFVASNLNYLAGTSAGYVQTANSGGGTSSCVAVWADAPAASNHIIGTVSNLRMNVREIGGGYVCAQNSSPLTYRAFATTPTAGTRHHWACCFDSGSNQLSVWLDGVLDNGALTGSATSLSADGQFNYPNSGVTGTQNLDEVLWLPGKATLSAQDLQDIRCATMSAGDTVSCTGATTDISHICSLGTGSIWLGFESDATDRCGNLNGSEVGVPSYSTY